MTERVCVRHEILRYFSLSRRAKKVRQNMVNRVVHLSIDKMNTSYQPLLLN